MYLDLYGSRLATISAIQGHAPAAGCFIAMACDYRIMSGGSIGLNETKLGIAGMLFMCFILPIYILNRITYNINNI